MLRFPFIQFYYQPEQQSPQFCEFFFFLLLIIIRSGRLAEIRWSVCTSKSQRSLCVSFSKTDAGLGIYHLFIWSNLNFLHKSKWITLPTLSCLVLYSFCANLLHSLIMWLIGWSLSPHNLHLLFCCVLSILALIWLVVMAFIIIIVSLLAKSSLQANSSHQRSWVILRWSLGDSKSSQISRTHFSILADLSNVVVWIVLIHPPIFHSSDPLSSLLAIDPNVPITITVTLIFHSFLSSLVRSKYLLLLLLLLLLLEN